MNHLFCRACVIAALLFFSCSRHALQKQELASSNATHFYTAIPITRYSDIQTPCISIEIEQHSYTMELDLGSNGILTLSDETLSHIQNKSPAYQSNKYSITGAAYPYKAYKIPHFRIGNCDFSSTLIRSDSAALKADSIVHLGTGEYPPPPDGSLGWPAFTQTNLLIDTHREMIAFCSGWQALESQGYKESDFHSVPFSTTDGLIILNAKIADQDRTCILDTGATLNFLHDPSVQRTPDEEISLIPYATSLSKDLTEEVSFMHLPLNLPLKIDAVLGMDFVHNHVIFIDFSTQTLYFSKNTPDAE